MKRALIIVNYNDSAAAVKLAEKAAGFSCVDRVYIVDNCSTDESWAVLSSCKEEKHRLIQTGENKGYSFAMNVGCRAAIHELGDSLLLISNSDIQIEQEADIKPLFEAMINGWTVVGPVIQQNEGMSRGWKLPKPKDDLMMNIPILYRWYERKHLFYPERYYTGAVSQVQAVSGCFFGIRSNFWQNMGGFDEEVFLYYEENILGSKAKLLGERIGVVNSSHVIHLHSVSVDQNLGWLQKYDQLKRSQVYYEKKYNDASPAELWLLGMFASAARMIYRICRKEC